VHGVVAIGWAVLVGVTLTLFVLHRNRLLTLVLIGIVGMLISVGFAYLSAPDLALTQISVEVVTIVLMLLALNFLPKTTPVESSVGRRLRDLAIAGAAGVGIAALAWAMMTRDFAFPSISGFHLAESKPGAGGTNAVNTIIVDFRGYDTFGEIIVLGIAALLIFALVEGLLRAGPANDRLLAWVPDTRRAGDRHPLMMVVATRLILPVALMVGVYIFLRGHNMPGGGFVAGLVFAIALVMQYMASGFAWTQARQRIDYHTMIALGVICAALTGVGAWFNGLPFLTSAYTYIDIGPLTDIGLATAALFDLGVFLCVLGAVMLALASLSRVAIRAGETVNVKAFDIDPSDKGA
jgi:multicomponent K+:H+ antiporter subunit A